MRTTTRIPRRTIGGTLLGGLLLASLGGCATASAQRGVLHAARPILTLSPDVAWTPHYNELVGHGPRSIDVLMQQPAMTRRAAPDSLEVMLHTSLVWLLADPQSRPPLSVRCLETTLGVLHFDIKVAGRSLGPVAQPTRTPPRAWHDLYPATFDHALAAHIDIDSDRRAMQAWYQLQRARGEVRSATRPLRPDVVGLWRVLARRPADAWGYAPEPTAILCAGPPADAALLRITTFDYNLVRAACIWLGSSGDAAVERRLVDTVASPLPLVAYNARFALRYSPRPQIRHVIDRFDRQFAEDLPPRRIHRQRL